MCARISAERLLDSREGSAGSWTTPADRGTSRAAAGSPMCRGGTRTWASSTWLMSSSRSSARAALELVRREDPQPAAPPGGVRPDARARATPSPGVVGGDGEGWPRPWAAGWARPQDGSAAHWSAGPDGPSPHAIRGNNRRRRLDLPRPSRIRRVPWKIRRAEAGFSTGLSGGCGWHSGQRDRRQQDKQGPSRGGSDSVPSCQECLLLVKSRPPFCDRIAYPIVSAETAKPCR